MLVELGRADRRAAGEGGGALEVHLQHPAEAVAGDRDGVVVAGGGRLDERAVLDADALGGAGAVDVEEVAVDGGDGAGALGRPGQRLGLGHLAGVDVVGLAPPARSAVSASARSQPSAS